MVNIYLKKVVSMNIKEKHIICLTGLTGSGKTTVKKMFEEAGLQTFYTKDLHEIAFKNKEAPSDKMAGNILFDEKYGFIKNIMDYIQTQSCSSDIILFDSIRSTDELSYIKSLGFKSFTLVKTHTNEKERLTRLINRDNCKVSDIERRDSIDLGADSKYGYNMAEVFNFADYTINMTNKTEEIKQHVSAIIGAIKGGNSMSNNEKDFELEMKFSADKDFSNFLLDNQFTEKKHKHQIDTYYVVDELLEGKRSWVRVREDKENGKSSFDFHKLISEYATDETEIAMPAEDAEKMKSILKGLGHKVKCVVDKERRSFQRNNVEPIIREAVFTFGVELNICLLKKFPVLFCQLTLTLNYRFKNFHLRNSDCGADI